MSGLEGAGARPTRGPDFIPDGFPTLETIEELPAILTKPQAAWLLQVSPTHLENAAKRGDVPSTRLGNARRFSKQALLGAVRGDQGH